MSTLDMTCWEFLYHIEKDNIKTKTDVIILMVHFVLIKNEYRCIHEDAEKNPVETSELLPVGWNRNSQDRQLTYTYKGVKFDLGARLVEDLLTLNLLNVHTKSVNSIVLTLDQDVRALQGPLSTMVPNFEQIFLKIWNGLVGPSMSSSSLGAETHVRQVEPPSRDPDPNPAPQLPPRLDSMPQVVDPLGVGSRDLNPFAPMGPGGGMLMENPRGRLFMPDRDFPGPGRLPRGAVPPGARFDPIHPLGPRNRLGGPDPDHLPMPGNFDPGSYFM